LKNKILISGPGTEIWTQFRVTRTGTNGLTGQFIAGNNNNNNKFFILFYFILFYVFTFDLARIKQEISRCGKNLTFLILRIKCE
jgi:hypothetical protein